MCIRQPLICSGSPLGYAHERVCFTPWSIATFNCGDLSHGTGSNGWAGRAGKTPSFVSVAAAEGEETLMQADGTEKGYNYVSVPPQVLAGYPAVLDIIKPSLPRSSPNPFRSHRRQPVLCLRSRPSLSKIRRVRISHVAGCFTSKMKLLAREEWGKQQSLLLMCPLVKEKLTSLTL